ncbi:hypothetical protein OGAPHI_004013 [Ogataea philodendri]|uniref:Inheritance of peroxisomes protein 1 n=1 Tax=Ogataea philodendri TaxID=1378263 RepID=A0A9P8T579_9ASCO|nr:uncharacterized protein OGAPHI_004013 [Ogataea philodendri]KAH3665825.1 hypothetical protein OGAPHI_004013 [Ogataea philodendri]
MSFHTDPVAAQLWPPPTLSAASDSDASSLTESLIQKFQHEFTSTDHSAGKVVATHPSKHRIRSMRLGSPKKRADRPSSRARLQSLFKKTKKELPESQPVEERTVVFQCDAAKITSYDVASDRLKPVSSGRSLGHGQFEIYQINNKSVTYFSCGSVVYPIMQKLKVLKISRNEFIVPLYNPERYWKITLITDNTDTLREADEAFDGVCQFKTVYDEELHDERVELPQRVASQDTVQSSSQLSPSYSSSSLNSTIACFDIGDEVETKDHDFLQHPIPIKLRSVSSSLDSVLDRFQIESDEEDKQEQTPATPPMDENESTMTASDLRSELRGRSINKRYSLTFKACDVSLSTVDLDLDFLREEDESAPINGSTILRGSQSMQMLRRSSPQQTWTNKLFGW